MIARILAPAVIAMAVMAAPVSANEGTDQAPERPSYPVQEGWRVTVGAGAIFAPSFEGDDDYRLSALPNIQIAYGERFFASVQSGVGYRLVNQPSLRAGPILKVQFSREEDGKQPFAITGKNSTDLRGLGDVGTSAELGGFVEYDIGSLKLGLEARQAVTGHDGLVADLSANRSGMAQIMGTNLIWSAGPRARFVDDNYRSAYFGVTSAQSTASGLSAFKATGGLHSVGISANLIMPLTADRSWVAVLIAGFDRLQGDAAESPLVRKRGNANQAAVGLFVSRQF